MVKHLTDHEVQQFVVDKQQCEATIVEHIHNCNECKMKSEIYQSLIIGIKQQPEPVFDFDLSAAVLKQLPASGLVAANDKLLTWIFIFLCGGLIGTTTYFFRGYLVSMFK